ncbi:hypothetical protein [Cytobacillus sp.]|uniref:hypothetical protein n=1 Tax=Cytobacillus sp. TaxID=2675269 RepID=UPI0035159A7D
MGVKTPLKALLIFINPEFHLYQAKMNLPAIFPAQTKRFIDRLKLKSQQPNKKHLMLADKLMSMHLKDNPYGRRFEYTFEKLEKGVQCASCGLFMSLLNKNNLKCSCGSIEKTEFAILRSAEEYKILFPEEKITTKSIHMFCNILNSKRSTKRSYLSIISSMDLVRHPIMNLFDLLIKVVAHFPRP